MPIEKSMPASEQMKATPLGVASPPTGKRGPGRAVRWLVMLDDGVGRLEDWFLVAAQIVIAVLVMLAVLARYIWNDPLTWDQELIVALFTWLMFIGAAAGIRQRLHIRVDLVGGLFKKEGFRWIASLSVVVGAVIVIALLLSALANFRDVLGALTPMLEMSQGVLDGALPVALIFILLHMTRLAVEHDVSVVFEGELEAILSNLPGPKP